MNKEITKQFIENTLNLVLSDDLKNLIIGVMAPTGSGKSTTLIESIQRQASEILNRNFKIYVVEPTIPATIGLYKRMVELYGDEIQIGYAAESNVNYNNNTEIVYCTGGHMENKMLSNFQNGEPKTNIDFCDVIILDEAHRESLDQDTIVALWKTALLADAKVTKINICFSYIKYG